MCGSAPVSGGALGASMDRIDSFADVANAYINWAERAERPSSGEDARDLLALLISLYGAALTLPGGEAADDDRESTSQEEWAVIYARCANLPFDVYWEVFNPLTPEAEEPVGASLGDDLADIHRDLKRGMTYYTEGKRDAAAWEWQFNFRAHWGHHASAAIYALHAWWAGEYFNSPGA